MSQFPAAPATPPLARPGEVWITPDEAGALLGVPGVAVFNWMVTDVGLPHLRLTSKTLRCRRAEVLAWQRSRERVVPKEWKPIGSFPGEPQPIEGEQTWWMLLNEAAAAVGVKNPVLAGSQRREEGLPFAWIGRHCRHSFIYDRRDVEVFVARCQAGVASFPPKKKPREPDLRTPERRKADRANSRAARKRISVEVWREMGYSEEEIGRRLKL